MVDERATISVSASLATWVGSATDFNLQDFSEVRVVLSNPVNGELTGPATPAVGGFPNSARGSGGNLLLSRLQDKVGDGVGVALGGVYQGDGKLHAANQGRKIGASQNNGLGPLLDHFLNLEAQKLFCRIA